MTPVLLQALLTALLVIAEGGALRESGHVQFDPDKLRNWRAAVADLDSPEAILLRATGRHGYHARLFNTLAGPFFPSRQ